MANQIRGIDTLSDIYSNRLSFFGVRHPVGKCFLKGYRNAGEFGDNLRAPFQIPVIAAANLIYSAVAFLEHALLFGITFMTFDFSTAKDHGIQMINSVTNALYTSVRAVFDTIVSALELLTRSVATVIEGVSEVVSTCTR